MTAEERRLLRLWRALDGAARQSLSDYAEFLVSRHPRPSAEVAQAPLDLPRPAEESVVKAIRRLMATYPMLDRDKLLHETSALMTRHVVHKQPAPAVIDELELVFRRYYDEHLNDPAG